MRYHTLMITASALAVTFTCISASHAKGYKKYDKERMFSRTDTDNNGVLSKQEVHDAHRVYIEKIETRLMFLKKETENIDLYFDEADNDKNGVLSKKEAKAMANMRRDAWEAEHGAKHKGKHRGKHGKKYDHNHDN